MASALPSAESQFAAGSIETTNAERLTFSGRQCFGLGLAVLLPIFPQARLTLFDLIAALLILFNWRATQSVFKTAIVLVIVSLVAMATSSYINQSDVVALVGRSYSMIAVLIEMMAYFIIIRGSDEKGRALLTLGAMIGICCHYFYPVDPRIVESAIKFLLGIPIGVALLALFALAIRRPSSSTVLIPGLMIAYAVFCFLVGARSNGGVFFAAALFVLLIGYFRAPSNYGKFAPFVMIAVAIIGYGITELYTTLAIMGLFGERAAGIAAFQASLGSILLGGRPELIVNIAGIMDSPWIGVGITNYPSLYIYELINLRIYSSADVFDTQNVLYHSTILGTAFESGLIAALFWIYLFYIVLFAIPILGEAKLAVRAYLAPLMIITVWHFFASPPIPYNRFLMGIALGFAFHTYSRWAERRRETGSKSN